MNQPGTIKTFIAATAIARFSVIALAAAESSVKLATDKSEYLIGVSAEPVDIEAGERVDVISTGIVEVRAGALIAKGAWLTVDAEGSVITASDAAEERIGRALEAANAADDVIPMEIIKGLG